MALVNQHPKIASQTNAPTTKVDMPINDSSFLMGASYDPTSLQLTITMKNGGQYSHYPFYPAQMTDFQEARSKNEFYAREIRGKGQTTKVIDHSVGKKISKT